MRLLIILLLLLLGLMPVLALDVDGDSLPGYSELALGTNPFNADTDGEGLSDGAEVRLGTDPTLNDTDDDGLSDFDEIELKTDPVRSDSDEDGVSDGDELKIGTKPLKADSDEDGLNDGEELKLGVNPLKPDTDGDGLVDGKEVAYGSDPLSKDSDGDGLDDYFEVSNSLNPADSDTDGDGLDDGFEVNLGINPRSRDTDGDGLNDYEEVMKYGTYADKIDSDDDGVIDSREIQLGLDPLNTDTDGDGLSDGYELSIGTSPEVSWRGWFNEDTLKSVLSDVYLKEVMGLAKQVDGESYIDKIWNVLGWVDENVEYNYSKAENIQDAVIQTPFETAASGSGICTDYSILIAALLLNLDVNPVYILDISYMNESVGHATAAVKIDGELFVLDQHLPPIHIGAYYHTSLTNGHIISNITIYEILKTDVVEVRVVDSYDGKQIKEMYRGVEDGDLKAIRNAISEKFRAAKGWFNEDTRLKNIAESELECRISGKTCPEHYLPYGFSKGVVLTVYEPAYYYHPALVEKFADMVVQELEGVDEYDSYYFAVGKGSYKFNSSTEPAIIIVGCFAR